MHLHQRLFALLLTALFVQQASAQYSGTAPYMHETAGLIINEISNGPSSSQNEYVELIVTGPSGVVTTVDLTGYVIDDNNVPGGSGTNSTGGHIRFGACFSAIPVGALIIVYNGNSPNPSLPAADPFDANNDLVYVVAHNDACMQQCDGSPSSSSPNYCPCTIGTPPSSPQWQLNFNNSGDIIQIRDLCGTPVHAVYYPGTANPVLQYTTEPVLVSTAINISQSGKVIVFDCNTTTNWDDATNFVNLDVTAGGETPGVANSPNNDGLIQSIRLGTFVPGGMVWSCEHTDAGVILPPAPFGAPPVEICPGGDLVAFSVDYTQPGEIDPNGLGSGFTFEYGYILTNSTFPNNILATNTSGDFDFSALPADIYYVWGISYFGTSGAGNMAAYLAGFSNIDALLSDASNCGRSVDISDPLEVTIGSLNVDIIGGGPYCLGSTANLGAPILPGAVYSWAGPGGASGSGQTLTVNSIGLAQTGTYTVTVSATGCTGTGETNLTISLNSPEVTLDGSGVACQGQDYNLVVTSNFAQYPLTVTYTLSTGENSNFQVNGSPETIQIPNSGSATLSVTSITDVAGCTASNPSQQHTFSISAGPVFANGFEQCVTAAEYSCSFDIIGTGPYNVTGNTGGAMFGNIFLSNNIPLTQAANFTVTDGNGCTAVYSAAVPACAGCLSFAGSMSSNILTFCGSSNIIVNHNNNQVIDSDDIMVFYMYTDPTNPLASLVATSTTTDFSGLVSLPGGTTVYVIAAVGNPAPVGGGIDPNDPCVSLSAAPQTIIIAEPVNFSVTLPILYCDGDALQANVTINNPAAALGPWTVSYSINGGTPTTFITNSATNNVIPFPAGITGPNSIEVSVTTANCPNGTPFNGNFVVIPVIETDVTQTLCPGQSITVGAQVFDVNNQDGDVVLTSITGCDSTVHVDLTFLPQLNAILTASTTSVCPGDSVQLSVSVPGSPVPADITVNPGNIVLTGVTGTESFWVYPTANVTYSIVNAVVSGSTCPVNLGSGLSISMNGFNTDVAIMSDYNGYAIRCYNASNGAALAQALNGTQPYTFEWSDGHTTAYNNNLEPGKYYITITDATGCFTIDSVELDAPPGVQVGYYATEPTCFDSNDGELNITGIVGGVPGYYVVLDGQGHDHTQGDTLVIGFLEIGPYELIVIDSNNCQYPVEVQIPGPAPYMLNLGPDITLNYGDSIELAGYANFDIDSTIWSPATYLNRIDTPFVITRPFQEVTYTMTAFDTSGCQASDQITIFVERNDGVFGPNVFSPDGNGLNDYFTIFADLRQVTEIVTLRVYDRWGNQVFGADNIPPSVENLGWDGTFRGKPLNPQVLVWYAELRYFDEQVKTYRGNVTLIR